MARKRSRTPEERERARAIAEQRRSGAAGIHKGRHRRARHREVVTEDGSQCECGEDWPCYADTD